jgi:ABC-type multidrug transport system ATPase subunit
MDTIIEVNQLTKKYGALTAVDDLSFTVNKGDVYGFLGQNGAGKSTTIRMLLTLIRPTSGTINIFSKDLRQSPMSILQQTGAIIEKPDLYNYLSAYDNLRLFAKLSGVKPSQKMLMERLATVGLEQRSHSKVKTFSQGMKQRLGIAVALVHDPSLIILDEPSNGLDPQGIADMRHLILSLKDQGKTILISSHLLSEIERVANRMLILHKGKKVVEGTVRELLDPADTIVTVETTDDSFARHLIAGFSFTTILPDERLIRLRMHKREVPQLVQALSDSDLGILSVQSRPSLEDFFISLTNPESHVEPVNN